MISKAELEELLSSVSSLNYMVWIFLSKHFVEQRQEAVTVNVT